MQEIKLIDMINRYFDGELQKSEEANLFSNLATDQDTRDYFKKLSIIRNTVDNSSEDFPIELEERILRSVGSKSSFKKTFLSNIRIFPAIAYATAVILIFIAGYLFSKISTYQEKVESLSQQVQIQSRTIQMLYNSLPGVEVKASFDNEIVIKPNI